MLLGLSILLASVSFLCYRHPPASWSFLSWLRRQELQDIPHRDAPDLDNVKSGAAEENAISIIGDYLKDLGAAEDDSEEDEEKEEEDGVKDSTSTKAESDRKAMPPPPFSKKTTAAQVPSAPTFRLEPSSSEPPSVPSFPAINSAQRASGGRGPRGWPRCLPLNHHYAHQRPP